MKNIRVVFFVMVAIVFSIFSTVCFAEPMVITETVVLQCDTNDNEAEGFFREGISNVQFSVKTIGIREYGTEEVIEVIKRLDLRRNNERMIGDDGRAVHISAVCLPSLASKRISITGLDFSCERGQGIRIEMRKLIGEDHDQFHAVLELTTTIYDDPAEPENPEQVLVSTSEPEPEPQLTQVELLLLHEDELIKYFRKQGYSELTIAKYRLQLNSMRQRELNSELGIIERERQMLEIQRIVLRTTTTGVPPQPTPVNPSVNLGLNLGFSGSG